jgi:hypothetical protein
MIRLKLVTDALYKVGTVLDVRGWLAKVVSRRKINGSNPSHWEYDLETYRGG